jgi:serine protease
VASQVSSRATYFAGMTSQTTLLGVKVCSLVRGGCPSAAVLNGILYAVDSGAQVINMSLGGGFLKRGQQGYHSLLNRVFQYAEKHGVTIVVAAGNSELDMDHVANAHFTYCDQTHVICVSATGATQSGAGFGPWDDVDQFAFYSNFGRARVDVAAPGGNYVPTADGSSYVTAAWVYSLCPRTKLVLFQGALYYTNCSAFPTNLYLSGYAGTSQASPHVAGLAALLYAEGVTKPSQVRHRIAKGADDLGQSGTDPYYGSGRINVARTLGL